MAAIDIHPWRHKIRERERERGEGGPVWWASPLQVLIKKTYRSTSRRGGSLGLALESEWRSRPANERHRYLNKTKKKKNLRSAMGPSLSL